MSKKKKSKRTQQPPQKMPLSRDEQVMRLAHEILIKKIEPAGMTLEEAIDVLSVVAKALVLSNTEEDDPEDRAGMIAWIEERFVGALADIDPSIDSDDDHPHVWLIAPQGLITEPIGIMWSGSYEEDSVQVLLEADLPGLRNDIAEMAGAVHVIEGVDGLAITDPEWNGEDTISCGNPECSNVHDVHLMVAENLFQRAMERPAAPN